MDGALQRRASQQSGWTDDESLFSENEDPNRIVTRSPQNRFKLGYLAVMGLVINRMIGTGIFMTPARVVQGTGSTGATLMFWFAGVIYAFSGVHVYIEYGLNVPRRTIGTTERGVPRSGGDLNYLKYVYQKPAYRPDTLMFIASLFGISFIILGNMAGNAISFGVRVLEASNVEVTNGAVRGIAVAVSVVAGFIHTFSRKGGILLSSVFALIKICMMLFIIVTAICYGRGTFPDLPNSNIDRDETLTQNLSPAHAFSESSSSANGYAQAFLAIIFAFGGFEQPNYVLGEISRPHRTYPIAMATSVSIVCVLYMAVNVSYMVVVPKEKQLQQGSSVAQSFFQLTYGALSPDDNTGARIFSAFLAISSLGNIIVMTYTAARVKQEIAKEGLLPWPKFFGQNKDLSFGRLLRWAQRTEALNKPFGSILRLRWLAPEHHSERTPVGALVLHLLTCIVLLFATYGETPQNAYLLLTGIAAYVVNACFGSLLAAGILYLRFTKSRNWRLKATNIHPWLSVAAATVYLIGNLFPVITSWVKPEKSFASTTTTTSLLPDSNSVVSAGTGEPTANPTSPLAWFVVPTVGWAVLGFAALWWLGASFVVRRIERRTHTEFTIEKEYDYDEDPPGSGAYVQVHETVYLSWKGREILRDMTMHGHPVAGGGGGGMTDVAGAYPGMGGGAGASAGGFVGGASGGMNGMNGFKGMNVHANDYYGRYA
ncbi:hypothetical protein G647_08416 [Cladophialophora carrionii CBS 160.54]|uniref:Amino acid permease/ SLC12A domain-containing protein n=1 Tax=Cladophialophora carrionii CBS 160.54 TaxID=1279043 RepID=V9D192_9EURO|nr:uncharacterized protein G647_08416 [Cladophialophora carrionii CBS 160.54]ETI20381.1 hypothetical protein G647_08416 [Cladophialophora carrionii CBS 160.54]